MKTRIITAIIGLVIFVPVVIFSGTIVFPIFIALASIIAVFEMLKCMRLHRNVAALVSAEVYAILVCSFSRFGNNRLATFIIISSAYIAFNFIFAMFSGGKYKLKDVQAATISVVSIMFAFATMIFIRDLPYGKYAIYLVFIGSWVADSGAYFVGTYFGKHKLCPSISPKKTWEGIFGGLFFCLLLFLIYGDLVSILAKDYHSNLWLLMICGLILSVMSVFGDLVASFIKRNYNIKDYGFILPGHGGIIDRCDSTFAVSVTLWAFCMIFENYPLFIANTVA
ncbi:MAG: CDP-archaeol synthase [Clostridia bacterium]|nr:CDP-archaeol synthase [Clostridia bacterium]